MIHALQRIEIRKTSPSNSHKLLSKFSFFPPKIKKKIRNIVCNHPTINKYSAPVSVVTFPYLNTELKRLSSLINARQIRLCTWQYSRLIVLKTERLLLKTRAFCRSYRNKRPFVGKSERIIKRLQRIVLQILRKKTCPYLQYEQVDYFYVFFGIFIEF